MSPRHALALVALVTLAACGADGGSPAGPTGPTGPTGPVNLDTIPLRTLAAAHGLRIGAVAGGSFNSQTANSAMLRATLMREFSMMWSGNYLKFNWLRPNPTTYNFTWADSMVAFASTRDIAVRGHTLVWHSQLSTWVSSGGYSAAQADSIMADHIQTVMTRYKGKIAIWDVVNEAIADNATMRTDSYWYTTLGPDYIARAFRLAHAADSTAELYYNDYNIEGINAKSDATYTLLQGLIADTVPIHGIGFQGHFIVGQLPSKADLLANFARFAALGLKIQVTELDVRIPLPVNDANLAQQAADFRRVFEVCIETPACNAVELSNTFDGESWVMTTFPGYGSPGIYTDSWLKKASFYSVYAALKTAP